MIAPSPTVTPGPNTTCGSTRTSARQNGVMAEKHRFRRDQGRARPHGVEPQAALDFRFGFRQLRLVVDAQHFAGLAP